MSIRKQMKSFYEMLRILSEESEEERKIRTREEYYRVERERAAQARKEEQEEFRKKRKEAQEKNPYGRQSPILSPDWMDYAKSMHDQDLVDSPIDKFSQEVDDIICKTMNMMSSNFRGMEIPCGIHDFFPDAYEDEIQDEQLNQVTNLISNMYYQGHEAKDVASEVIKMIKKMGRI